MIKKTMYYQSLILTNQSGFTLLMVMLTILIIEIIFFLLSQTGGIQAKIAFNRLEKEKAGRLAEAGIAHGLWRIQEDPNWRSPMASLSLGEGSYTVTFTEDNPKRQVAISSQSVVNGTYSSAERTVHWLTIQPTSAGSFAGRDTYLREGLPTTKLGVTDPEDLMVDRHTVDEGRILIRFDLGKYPFPSDGRVISGRFLLSLYAQTGFPSESYHIHRVTNSWLSSQATWNNRYDGQTWNSAGGDYASSSEDSRTFTALGWQKWKVTSMARYWQENPSQNYGLLLHTSPIEGRREYTFRSSAYTTDQTQAPKLTLYYLDSRRP